MKEESLNKEERLIGMLEALFCLPDGETPAFHGSDGDRDFFAEELSRFKKLTRCYECGGQGEVTIPRDGPYDQDSTESCSQCSAFLLAESQDEVEKKP